MKSVAMLDVLSSLVMFYPRCSWIAKEKAAAMLRKNPILLDVRKPGEFLADNIPGSVNIPWDDLHKAINKDKLDRTKPILIFCGTGLSSSGAAMQLAINGYDNFHNAGSIHRMKEILQMATKSAQPTALNC